MKMITTDRVIYYKLKEDEYLSVKRIYNDFVDMYYRPSGTVKWRCRGTSKQVSWFTNILINYLVKKLYDRENTLYRRIY